MELVIDRNQWDRGSSESKLLRADNGKMCCLGFCAIALGYTKGQILQLGSPAQLNIPAPSLTYKMINAKLVECIPSGHTNTDACEHLMVLNDAWDMNEEHREKALINEFKQIGIEVKFIN